MTIKDVFSDLKNGAVAQVVVAQVASVDKVAGFCDLTVAGRPDRFDVRLRAVMDKATTGMVIAPKKGSFVLVGIIENKPESSFICGYSEIDEVYINVPQTEMRIDKEGFLMKRSSNNLGGLISELIDALTKLTVTTGTGPSGTPINISDFLTLKQKFSQLLKTS